MYQEACAVSDGWGNEIFYVNRFYVDVFGEFVIENAKKDLTVHRA